MLDDIIQQFKYHLISLKRTGTNSVFFEEYPAEVLSNMQCLPDLNSDEGGLPCTKSLEEMASSIKECPRCEELVKNRTQVVFGAGSRNARVIFVGEAPGHDEDIQGVPFVGKAGKLLTKMFASIGISRDDIYITNVLKCRPPENRNPHSDEIKNCSEFLEKQIDLIKPAVICTLGAVATQHLLQNETPISQLHGQKLNWHGITVLPTFHPSYLLRSPHMKREAWRDLITLKRIISNQASVV